MAIPPWPSKCPWIAQKVAIFGDICGHFEVTLELIFGTVGVFFDACRLQELKNEGSGRHSESETAFSSILGSAPRCSGGFSLQRELYFHFGGQWRTMSTLAPVWSDLGSQKLNYTHVGVSLSRCLVAKWGVVL